ncbi:hypothetical protein WJ542_21330 [Paraburkholderia sp. B3]|uniref:hypothetical protein n=1 Tax=Paraburkholderia sp. B3 TaxID=3134791 RepID=UPI0039828129
MFRTLYAAAPYETPFSLLVALAGTTIEPQTRYRVALAFQPRPPLLQTAPCRLSRFCTLTEDFYGTPRQVLMDRTLYPMYMGCMKSDPAAALAANACDATSGRPCLPPLPSWLSAANRYGLECPECASELRALTGRRCSLSFHCIPLQARCPIHGCLYRLAHPCSALETGSLVPGSPVCTRNTLRLGATLLRFLHASRGGCWLDELRSQLAVRGYAASDGRTRWDAVSRDLGALYSAGFEDARLGGWVAWNCLGMRVHRCEPQSSRPPHPVEVALLLNALDEIEFTSPRTRTMVSQSTAHQLDDLAKGDGRQAAANLPPGGASARPSGLRRRPDNASGTPTRPCTTCRTKHPTPYRVRTARAGGPPDSGSTRASHAYEPSRSGTDR